MKQFYLVFKGDAWLSRSSLVSVGVYDSIEKAILDILEDMSLGLMLNAEQSADKVANMLAREHQTYGFETNYIIKKANLNEWEEIY